ncbi:MAG: hypothetical protein WC627_13155 [Legionella sp.]|jgi:hypothetical protein
MYKHTNDKYDTSSNKRYKTSANHGIALMDVALTLEKLVKTSIGTKEDLINSKEFCNAVSNAFTRLRECLKETKAEDLHEWAFETKNNIQFQISRLLSDCGNLARFSRVHLTAESLEYMLKQLKGRDRISNPLAKMSLLGLSMLTKAGKIDPCDGLFRCTVFNNLATDLLSIQKVDHRVIYYFMNCLASLCKSKLLDGQLDMANIQALFKDIPRNSKVPFSNVAMPIHDLGVIALHERVNGNIDAKDLLGLIRYRYEPENDSIPLSANMVYGLNGLIIKRSITNIDILGPYVDQILEKCTKDNVSPEHAHQFLIGIVSLWNTYRCSIKQIKLLLGIALEHSNRSEDTIISNIKNYFITFKESHTHLNDSFQTLLTRIATPMSDTLKQTLRGYANNLEGYGTWASDLRAKTEISLNTNNNDFDIDIQDYDSGLPPPLAEKDLSIDAVALANQFLDSLLMQINSTNQNNQPMEQNQSDLVPAIIPTDTQPTIAAISAPMSRPPLPVQSSVMLNNKIYGAIASKNMHDLLKVLSLTPEMTRIQNANKSTANNNSTSPFFTTNKNNSNHKSRIWHNTNAERLVIQFFKNIPANDLHQLYQNANHEYFDILLRAISPHNRYQLAINQTFRPLMMYLPFNQLHPIVDDFIDRGLYIDHKAIMQIIWDLRARRTNEQGDNVQKIMELEQKLVKICLAFHEKTKHRHVEQELQGFIKLLAQNGQQENLEDDDIIDDDDEDMSMANRL